MWRRRMDCLLLAHLAALQAGQQQQAGHLSAADYLVLHFPASLLRSAGPLWVAAGGPALFAMAVERVIQVGSSVLAAQVSFVSVLQHSEWQGRPAGWAIQTPAACPQAAEQGGALTYLAFNALRKHDPLWGVCTASSATAAELARRRLPARLHRYEAGVDLSGIARAAQAGLFAEGELVLRTKLVSSSCVADAGGVGLCCQDCVGHSCTPTLIHSTHPIRTHPIPLAATQRVQPVCLCVRWCAGGQR